MPSNSDAQQQTAINIASPSDNAAFDHEYYEIQYYEPCSDKSPDTQAVIDGSDLTQQQQEGEQQSVSNAVLLS